MLHGNPLILVECLHNGILHGYRSRCHLHVILFILNHLFHLLHLHITGDLILHIFIRDLTIGLYGLPHGLVYG